MKFDKALNIALQVKGELTPYCTRIAIAGSIRRQKPEVKDIEIVAIRDSSQLFEFQKWFKDKMILKGSPLGKYIQINLKEGINLDLFFAEKNNWGTIFTIRTGSAEFSHNLAIEWSKQGYTGNGGILEKDGKKFHFEEEKELFEFLKIPYIDPQKRI